MISIHSFKEIYSLGMGSRKEKERTIPTTQGNRDTARWISRKMQDSNEKGFIHR
jgi:hypothetical protein